MLWRSPTGLLLICLLLPPVAASAGPKKKRDQIRPTKLSRPCEQVTLVEHDLDFLAAPVVEPASKARPLPARSYSELAFVTDEWLAFRDTQAKSEIQVINADGGEALPISPPGAFCGGLERWKEGVLFYCQPDGAAPPEKRAFFTASPPEWKAEPSSGEDWSHTRRARDAGAMARRGYSGHDVYGLPSGHRVAVPRGGTPPHPFFVEEPEGGRLFSPPTEISSRFHYPASFLESPRIAAALMSPKKPAPPGTAHPRDPALYVLDLEKKETVCASPKGSQQITAYLGAGKRYVLYLRGQLPIWRPLEIHLADVEAGIDHHLGSVKHNANAVIKVLPGDRFLLALMVENPRTKFHLHFLLVDGGTQTVRHLIEPMPGWLRNFYGLEASPGGGWLRYRDGRSHPWVLPIPR